jgi:hypothetical protein
MLISQHRIIILAGEKLIMLTKQPNMLTGQQYNGSLRLGPYRRVSTANRQICDFEVSVADSGATNRYAAARTPG